MTPALERLAAHIRAQGPIRTVRVSMTRLTPPKAWAAVRYEITLSRRGIPIHTACPGPVIKRPSLEAACGDALAIAAEEGLIPCQATRRLTEVEAASVLRCLDLSLCSIIPEKHP